MTTCTSTPVHQTVRLLAIPEECRHFGVEAGMFWPANDVVDLVIVDKLVATALSGVLIDARVSLRYSDLQNMSCLAQSYMA